MSYDPTLSTDKDWVRASIGDTNSADESLIDATIDAVLAAEPNKWFAAATCGEMIVAQWRAGAKGAIEKAVGQLRLRLSGEESDDVYLVHLNKLRIRGAQEQAGTTYLFKAV